VTYVERSEVRASLTRYSPPNHRAGAIIGYAGDTRSARGGAVHALALRDYRSGTAQNPYPRLAAGA